MKFGIVLFLIFSFCLLRSGGDLMDDTPPTDSPKEAKEYCEGAEFRPRCGPDEVIVIKDAHLARSRCGQPHQVDCTVSVLPYIDYQCSGRRSCKQVLSSQDSELSRTWSNSTVNKCYTSSTSVPYSLNTSYECVKVEKSPCSMCETSHAKVTSPKGYLASIVTAETQDNLGCGSSRCPWSIQVLPGQVINVTLLDYATHRGSGTQRRQGAGSDGCARYVLIKERANPKDSQICGGKKRETNLYLSVSNTIEIHMINQDSIDWEGQFMIYYEAVGCPDLIPPKYSRMKRNGDGCEIDCPGTDLKWTLQCINNNWEGKDSLGVCPPIPGMIEPEPQQTGKTKGIFSATLFNLPMGVLLALVVAVAVIMGVCILTIGVVCLKRHQYDVRHKEDPTIYGAACSEFEFREIGGFGASLVPKTNASTAQSAKPRRPSTDLLMPGRDNTYALQDKRMESRPLPSLPTATSPHGSWRRDNPNQVFVQLHRTDSGSDGLNGNPSRPPTMVYRTGCPPHQRGFIGGPSGIPGGYIGGGAGTSGRGQGDSHHYFVLDPETQEEELAEARFQPPPAHQQPRPQVVQGRPPVADSRTVPRGHPRAPVPEEKCTCDHTSPGSNHNHPINEIPLRMVKDGSKAQTPLHSSDGTSSWP